MSKSSARKTLKIALPVVAVGIGIFFLVDYVFVQIHNSNYVLDLDEQKQCGENPEYFDDPRCWYFLSYIIDKRIEDCVNNDFDPETEKWEKFTCEALYDYEFMAELCIEDRYATMEVNGETSFICETITVGYINRMALNVIAFTINECREGNMDGVTPEMCEIAYTFEERVDACNIYLPPQECVTLLDEYVAAQKSIDKDV